MNTTDASEKGLESLIFAALTGYRRVSVPAEVCNHCGEVTVSSATANQLQETICGNSRPVKTIKVPVEERHPVDRVREHAPHQRRFGAP